jgi:hypothetical protein
MQGMSRRENRSRKYEIDKNLESKTKSKTKTETRIIFKYIVL